MLLEQVAGGMHVVSDPHGIVAHRPLFFAGGLVLATLAIYQPGTFVRRVGRLGLFLGLLLLVDSLANRLWSCLIWGRLYYSADYVVDFNPFWPITRKVIDATFGKERGELFGVSLFQLQRDWQYSLPARRALWFFCIV